MLAFRNPNDGELLEWLPFLPKKEQYQILKPDLEQASFLRPEIMDFWGRILLERGQTEDVHSGREEL